MGWVRAQLGQCARAEERVGPSAANADLFNDVGEQGVGAEVGLGEPD